MKLKKKLIVLVHENHDKCPNVTPVQHFRSAFDHANFVSSFRGSKSLPKLNSVMFFYFFKYEHLKRFVWNYDNNCAWESGTFRIGGDWCFCRCAMAEKWIRQHIFFSAFSNSLNVNLLFNSQNIMIEPILYRVLVYLKIHGKIW